MVFCAWVLSAHARQVPSFAQANLVLGQQTLDSVSVPPSPNATSLKSPLAVAVDPSTGKIFVSDTGNNRILRYTSVAALQSGSAAELVFGQTDFLGDTAPSAASNSLHAPAGIAVDAGGRLWVSDSGNNRVVMYADAATLAINDPDAALVLGQPNAAGESPATTRYGMTQPAGIWIDSSGRLWVADSGNNRVLRFDNAASKTTGADADGVLGQQGFTTATPGKGNQQLDHPAGVTVDPSGTLWVADEGNNRIFGYPAAGTISDGTNAARVLGQPDFNTTTFGRSANTVHGPCAVFADLANNLWVVDRNNNRVIRFANLKSIENGKPASTVIGQPDFLAGDTAVDPRHLSDPRGAFVQEDGQLWIADFGSSRVLRYATEDSDAPVVQIKGKHRVVTEKSRIVLRGTASDDVGVASVTIKSLGKPVLANGTTSWKKAIRLKKSRTVVKALAIDATGKVSLPAKVVIVRKPQPLL